MKKFDTSLLMPEQGLSGPHVMQGLFIRIPLRPFKLGDRTVETSVRLDFVRIPSSGPSALAQKTFTFPINPEPGYIDGSIYIEGAHHPVDVTKIVFGDANNGGLHATFASVIDFTFEGLGDFGKTPWDFRALLGWSSEAQTA